MELSKIRQEANKNLDLLSNLKKNKKNAPKPIISTLNDNIHNIKKGFLQGKIEIDTNSNKAQNRSILIIKKSSELVSKKLEQEKIDKKNLDKNKDGLISNQEKRDFKENKIESLVKDIIKELEKDKGLKKITAEDKKDVIKVINVHFNAKIAPKLNKFIDN